MSEGFIEWCSKKRKAHSKRKRKQKGPSKQKAQASASIACNSGSDSLAIPFTLYISQYNRPRCPHTQGRVRLQFFLP